LCELLQFLQADVCGVALDPIRNSLFDTVNLGRRMTDLRADIRESESFLRIFEETSPELVIHLAAQSIVSIGRENPVETFSTNLMGTVNVLEAARAQSIPILVISSDKCYRPSIEPSRIGDPLGGFDPYSSSKAGVEMIVEAYREGYGMTVATARAGNAIGGGDWAVNRRLPDLMRALFHGQILLVRHPSASRPWQHVLDLCWGYAILSARLLRGEGIGAWNFGPSESVSVRRIIEAIPGLSMEIEMAKNPPAENPCLRLDSSATLRELGWRNRLNWRDSVEWTVDDYRLIHLQPEGMQERMAQRLGDYSSLWEVLN